MTKRDKPTELTLVGSTETADILEVTPEPTPRQATLARYESRLYSGAEILERLTPREWLIPGWLPRDGVTSIYAPSGMGKSFYALTLGLELARGGSFAGYEIETAEKVLYVAAERPRDQRDRLEAWVTHHEESTPGGFELLADAPQLTNPESVSALCDLIEARGFRVVILDTFARMTLGIDENSSRDMGPVMDSLDRIREATHGGSVTVVHHTGKDTAKGARGSTAFLGALDVGVVLEGDSTALKARVDKSNAGEKPLPEWYKLEQVALDELTPGGPKRLSAVLVETYAKQAASDLDPLVLALLREHGELSNRQIREALEEDHQLARSQTTVSKVLRRLETQGEVRSTGGTRPRFSVAPLYPES